MYANKFTNTLFDIKAIISGGASIMFYTIVRSLLIFLKMVQD